MKTSPFYAALAAALISSPAHADTLEWDSNVPHQVIPITQCLAAIRNMSDGKGWTRSECNEVAFSNNGSSVNIHWRVFHSGGKSSPIPYVMGSGPASSSGAHVNAVGLTPLSGNRVSAFTVPLGPVANTCRVSADLLQCSGAARGTDGIWVFANTAKLQ